VGGYSWVWDTVASTLPDAVVDGVGTMTTSLVLGGGDSHYVHLRTMDNAGNWSSGAIELGPFWIDTSGPGSVTGLGSPSHVVGVWSNDNTIEAEWTAPGGGGSGVAGYSILWNGSASTDPDLTVETTALSTVSPPQTDGQRYVHVRAINGAGVAGPTSHLGAFRIDAKAPTALVATPHGGETWQAEDIETIEFGYIDTGSGVANLELHYSTDGGATFPNPNLIANPLIGTSSFAWPIPHDPSTAAVVRLRVTDVAGNIGEDVSGVFTLREIPTSVSPEVHSFALYQNVPNPFNPTTQIRYDVPNGAARVVLRVYDINGRLVRTLVDEQGSTGQNVTTWDGSDDRGSRVSSGIYFYQLSSGRFSQTRKMVILK